MTDQPSPLKNSPPPLPSLEELEKKIQHAKAPESLSSQSSSSGMGAAMRVATDLVAGVGVGLAVGYFIDRWLDTSPWFLLVCFGLGTAAGFRMMIQTAKSIDKE